VTGVVPCASVNVVRETVKGSSVSLKVALTLEFSATTVAPFAGMTDVTVGATMTAAVPSPLLLMRQPATDDSSSNAMSLLTVSVTNLDSDIILSLIFHTKKQQRI
jgi:hypothetical protein